MNFFKVLPVISVALSTVITPVSAGIHDFNESNAAPTTTRTKARVGEGQCVVTRDNSKLCYLKTSASNFSISILDLDHPSEPEVAHIDCSTGRWGAFGDIPKETLEWYFDDFCVTFG